MDPRSAIVGDSNGANVSWGDVDWRNPSRVQHSPTSWKTGFRETNVLYGDGHAETHRELKYYILIHGNHHLIY